MEMLFREDELMSADFTTALGAWYDATHIPISAFLGSSLLFRVSTSDSDLNLPMLLCMDLPSELPVCWHSAIFDHLLFGGLTLSDGRMLFFGPVLPFECSRSHAQKILSLIGRNQKDADVIMNYFNTCGRYTEVSLAASIRLLALLLGFSDPRPQPISWKPRHELPYEPRLEKDTRPMDASMRLLEEELLSYVRYGNVQALTDQMRRRTPLIENPPAAIPLYRPYIMMALTLASRAAVEGGVDYYHSLYVMNQYVEDLFDPRKDPSYIYSECYVRFAKMVADVRDSSIKDPLASAAAQYIRNHISQKINPRMLGEALGYNASYLCTQFKKHTGQTLSEYTRLAKTDEAKRLLSLKRLTCQDIAEELAYPSQSSFCDAFHSVTGMSPTAWQKEYCR